MSPRPPAEKDWQAPSFVRQLFEGNFQVGLIHPYPEPSAEDVERARPFMSD